jgi:hypothetical protein
MSAAHSEFRYLYRDASNYKAYGSLILRGLATEIDKAALIERLEAGEFFVAEQVGIPDLYEPLVALSGGVTHDDHAWHAFESIALVAHENSSTAWGTVEDLLKRFAAVQSWNVRLSAIYS